jgi:hypothetical protein
MDQKAPFEWLELSLTRELTGTDIVPVAAYREFVMQGNDEQTVEFRKKEKLVLCSVVTSSKVGYLTIYCHSLKMKRRAASFSLT